MSDFQAFDNRPNNWALNEHAKIKSFGKGGRIRDEAGNALFGFAVKDTKKSRKVSVIFNGHYRHHYKYPIGPVPPLHAMVRWENVPMCGLPMVDPDRNFMSDDRAIEKAVFEGKKPVGDLIFYHEQADEKAALKAKALEHGLEVIEYRLPHNSGQLAFVMIGVDKPIGELFDLNAVARFYCEATALNPPGFRKFLTDFSRLTPARALQSYDWANSCTAYQLIMTGMCLGYAFESTLAIILKNFPELEQW